MENIRIIEIPRLKMISSGFGSLEELTESKFSRLFPDWSSTIFPYDFMSYDPERKQLIWYCALTGEAIDHGNFEIIEFEGGLYAACVSIDENDEDGNRVYKGIKDWIAESENFVLDEHPGHYTMFHIITSPAAKKALGYNQLEIFVPIRTKEGK